MRAFRFLVAAVVVAGCFLADRAGAQDLTNANERPTTATLRNSGGNAVAVSTEIATSATDLTDLKTYIDTDAPLVRDSDLEGHADDFWSEYHSGFSGLADRRVSWIITTTNAINGAAIQPSALTAGATTRYLWVGATPYSHPNQTAGAPDGTGLTTANTPVSTEIWLHGVNEPNPGGHYIKLTTTGAVTTGGSGFQAYATVPVTVDEVVGGGNAFLGVNYYRWKFSDISPTDLQILIPATAIAGRLDQFQMPTTAVPPKPTTPSATTDYDLRITSAGAASWEVNTGGGGGGATNLGIGTRTSTTVPITSSTGSAATFPAATTTQAGALTGTDKAKLDGIAANANATPANQLVPSTCTDGQIAEWDTSVDPDAWVCTAKPSGGGGGGATNLGIGTRTTTTVPITSSTGTDATFPAATTSLAGAMASTDKSKLDGIAANAEVNVQADWDQATTTDDAFIQNKPLDQIVPNTCTDGQIAEWDTSVDPDAWVCTAKPSGGGGGGATNLGIGTRTTTTVPITSSTGTDATFPAATTSLAGAMASTDKSKLDGIAANAEVNVQADWTETTTTSDAYIANKPTIPSATPANRLVPATCTDGQIAEWDTTPDPDAWICVAKPSGGGGTGDITEVTTTAPLQGGQTSGPVALTISAASATATGVVELATDAETATGTDATRAVTPAGLESRIGTDSGDLAELGTGGVFADGVIPSGIARDTEVDTEVAAVKNFLVRWDGQTDLADLTGVTFSGTDGTNASKLGYDNTVDIIGGSGGSATVGTSGGVIQSASVNAAGTGYVGGTVSVAGGTGGTLTITVNASGAILTVQVANGGSGYSAGAHNLGQGSGGTAEITVNAAGAIQTLAVREAGSGYFAGNTYRLDQPDRSGESGGTATVTVNAAGAIQTATIGAAGTGYAVTNRYRIGYGANQRNPLVMNSAIDWTNFGFIFDWEQLGRWNHGLFWGTTATRVPDQRAIANANNIANITGGGGSGGTAQITVAGNGQILEVALVAAGTGYTAGTVTLDQPSNSGDSGGTATITVDGSGAIQTIERTAAGSGYTVGTNGAGFAFRIEPVHVGATQTDGHFRYDLFTGVGGDGTGDSAGKVSTNPTVYNGATASSGTVSYQIPGSGNLNRVQYAVIQFGRRLDLYANRIHVARWMLTGTQAAAGSGANFGFYSPTYNQSDSRVYLYDAYIINGTDYTMLRDREWLVRNEDIQSLDAAKLTGTIADARIPAAIARDSELPAAAALVPTTCSDGQIAEWDTSPNPDAWICASDSDTAETDATIIGLVGGTRNAQDNLIGSTDGANLTWQGSGLVRDSDLEGHTDDFWSEYDAGFSGFSDRRINWILTTTNAINGAAIQPSALTAGATTRYLWVGATPYSHPNQTAGAPDGTGLTTANTPLNTEIWLHGVNEPNPGAHYIKLVTTGAVTTGGSGFAAYATVPVRVDEVVGGGNAFLGVNYYRWKFSDISPTDLEILIPATAIAGRLGQVQMPTTAVPQKPANPSSTTRYELQLTSTGAASWTDATTSGDITAVNAGAGLINGGDTGSVTLDVNPGDGIEIVSDRVRVDADGPSLTVTSDGVRITAQEDDFRQGAVVGIWDSPAPIHTRTTRDNILPETATEWAINYRNDTTQTQIWIGGGNYVSSYPAGTYTVEIDGVFTVITTAAAATYDTDGFTQLVISGNPFNISTSLNQNFHTGATLDIYGTGNLLQIVSATRFSYSTTDNDSRTVSALSAGTKYLLATAGTLTGTTSITDLTATGNAIIHVRSVSTAGGRVTVNYALDQGTAFATQSALSAETGVWRLADVAVSHGVPDAPANTASTLRYELQVPANSGDATWTAAAGLANGSITRQMFGTSAEEYIESQRPTRINYQGQTDAVVAGFSRVTGQSYLNSPNSTVSQTFSGNLGQVRLVSASGFAANQVVRFEAQGNFPAQVVTLNTAVNATGIITFTPNLTAEPPVGTSVVRSPYNVTDEYWPIQNGASGNAVKAGVYLDRNYSANWRDVFVELDIEIPFGGASTGSTGLVIGGPTTGNYDDVDTVTEGLGLWLNRVSASDNKLYWLFRNNSLATPAYLASGISAYNGGSIGNQNQASGQFVTPVEDARVQVEVVITGHEVFFSVNGTLYFRVNLPDAWRATVPDFGPRLAVVGDDGANREIKLYGARIGTPSLNALTRLENLTGVTFAYSATRYYSPGAKVRSGGAVWEHVGTGATRGVAPAWNNVNWTLVGPKYNPTAIATIAVDSTRTDDARFTFTDADLKNAEWLYMVFQSDTAWAQAIGPRSAVLTATGGQPTPTTRRIGQIGVFDVRSNTVTDQVSVLFAQGASSGTLTFYTAYAPF